GDLMARTRRIIRTRRVAGLNGYKGIVNLECGHNIHTTTAELETMPLGHFICPHCPDEPAPIEPPSPARDGRLRCYYAHCMAIYGTPAEQRDVATLLALGFQVINPNTPEIEARVQHMKDGYAESPTGQYENGSAFVMHELFKPMAQDCDVL